MAYAVLRVILERLRAEGRLLDGHAPPLQTADGRPCRSSSWSARRTSSDRARSGSLRLHRPRRHAARPRRLAVPRRRGRLHAARRRARSRPATAPASRSCIKSGRRRAQVMEDARLIGQTSYIFEVGCGPRDRRRGRPSSPASSSRARARRVHAADRGSRRAGAAARALRGPARAPRALAPATARCRTCSAARWTRPRRTSCWRRGPRRAAARGQRRDLAETRSSSRHRRTPTT